MDAGSQHAVAQDGRLPPRRAAWAVLLSFFGSGIGHVYAGRAGKGLTLFGLALVPAPATFALAVLPAGAAMLYTLLALVLFQVLLYVYAIVSAGRAARRAPVPFAAGPFQRKAFYALLVFVSLGWSLGGSWLVRTHAFEAFYIPTKSMTPTLDAGDRVLVNKMRAGRVRKGDLVVFHSPQRPGLVWIKRVHALPGEAAGGQRLPPGRIYVLGDNRSNSRDSRHFGPVSLDAVIGVAEYVFWSRRGLGAIGPLE